MAHGVWCMMHGVWCMVHVIWCMVCGVWFMVCGVGLEYRVSTCIEKNQEEKILAANSLLRMSVFTLMS